MRSYTCPTVHTERKELSRAVDQQRMGALTSKLCSMRVLIANLMEVCVPFVTPLHAVHCRHCRKDQLSPDRDSIRIQIHNARPNSCAHEQRLKKEESDGAGANVKMLRADFVNIDKQVG